MAIIPYQSMKNCPKCKQDKLEEDFSSRGNGSLNSYCKVCQREYSRKHYGENKNKHNQRRYDLTKKTRKEHSFKIKKIKDNQPCRDCEIKYPHYVLEFDHLHSKLANVSEMPGKFGWDKIQNEIDKCEIVCSNCHKIRTYKRKITEYS